jgi:Protoglobin
MRRTQSTARPTVVAREIPGYDYGSSTVGMSPVTFEEFEQLKRDANFTDEDVHWLGQAGKVLADQALALAGKWRDIIASLPHLAIYWQRLDGKKDAQYAETSGLRLQQWILDTCSRPYDQEWLNYQHEIALRHSSVKKNETDHARIASPTIHLRHIIAFCAVITDPTIMKPFLAAKGRDAIDVDRMHQAWTKSIWLQIALWTEPYTNTRLAPNEW